MPFDEACAIHTIDRTLQVYLQVLDSLTIVDVSVLAKHQPPLTIIKPSLRSSEGSYPSLFSCDCLFLHL